MSMHDIEGVVETSVYCINKSNLPLSKKRDLLYNLYKFQAEYDTGYTNFRVKDILLNNHYMFALPVEQHPAYAERKEEFDGYVAKGYSEWLTDDSFFEPGDKDSPPLFYTDAGSETWKKLVESKVLTGDQAMPVNDMPILEVVLEVLELCCEQQDTYCAAEWFRTTLFYLLDEATHEDSDTINDIAEILFNDAILYAAQEDYYFKSWIEDYKNDIDEDYMAPIAKEWVKSYIDWEKSNDSNPHYYLHQTIQAFRKGDLDEAMSLCKKGLSLDPNNHFLLLYEAILGIQFLVRERNGDIESYKPWLERLEQLQAIEGEETANTQTIKRHSLYYIAYINVVCGNLSEARRIAEELVSKEQMPEAKQLLDYITSLEEEKQSSAK